MIGLDCTISEENGGDGFYGGLSVPYQNVMEKYYSHYSGVYPTEEVQPKMISLSVTIEI